MKTKEEWKQYFSRNYSTNNIFKMIINDKKCRVSYFYKYANEEHKKDKELNAFNFEKDGRLFELTPGIIDFEFIKSVYNIKKSFKIFLLPYEWKNNPEEKNFLEEVLTHHNKQEKWFEKFEMNWWFESGFWSDIEYTNKIKKNDLHHLNLAIINDLNFSSKSEDINCLLDMVNNEGNYLKHLSAKNKKLLPRETVLSYAREYGLKSLTKSQKDSYEIVKEAFHHQKISYNQINEKWKTPESLVDLLNYKKIWRYYYTDKGTTVMELNFLSPELLANKDVMKSCMIDGYNLLELRKMNNELFFDKDLKKIALQTHSDYKMIEDCLDDKEIILIFISNIKFKGIEGIELFEQTKRISEDAFKDKKVMTKYLSLKSLDNDMYFALGAKKALESYSIDELIAFIKINKEVYKVLPEELKVKWELVLPFYEQNMGTSNKMPPETINHMVKLSQVINSTATGGFKEILMELGKYALEEKLSRTLEQKEHTKKIKI